MRSAEEQRRDHLVRARVRVRVRVRARVRVRVRVWVRVSAEITAKLAQPVTAFETHLRRRASCVRACGLDLGYVQRCTG